MRLKTRVPEQYLEWLTAKLDSEANVFVPRPVLMSMIAELTNRRLVHPVALGEDIGEPP